MRKFLHVLLALLLTFCLTVFGFTNCDISCSINVSKINHCLSFLSMFSSCKTPFKQNVLWFMTVWSFLRIDMQVRLFFYTGHLKNMYNILLVKQL